MNRIAKEKLDPTFSTALKGSSADFSESSSNLISTFLFALILVFLILAAQFESFRDPLIIMFTIPLAITGAILSLWITGSTLNIFSEIGMIVLIGIVTKNGILIIEFANQRREQGIEYPRCCY
jgi:multidrug efflux pump